MGSPIGLRGAEVHPESLSQRVRFIERTMTMKVSFLSDADKYRLFQAEQLMIRAGFVELPDRTWAPPEADCVPDPDGT